MADTTSRRGGPRWASPHTERRDCALYYIDCLDPNTNYTTIRHNAYIGETGREPFIRFLEHLYDQPFGDTIVGQPRIDPRRFHSKAQVLAAEQEAVERLRPLYNYEWNLGNPDRIEVWRAQRQRAERDRARGVPSRWQRSGPSRVSAGRRSGSWVPRRRQIRAGRRLRSVRRAVVTWTVLALVVWFGLWCVLGYLNVRLEPALGALASGLVASMALEFRMRRR